MEEFQDWGPTIRGTKGHRVADPLPEIIVDSFAGGGGASTGIEMAMRTKQACGIEMENTDVTVAINHNGAALAMHTANHPGTIHMEADIWTVDPLQTTQGIL